jgi:hypothetical protein
MFWKLPALIAASAIVAANLATPSEAATRKRVVVQRAVAPPTVFVSRDESGRTRTRLIVQRRSYLDAGTEVLPGQRKFSDYANPPYYSPINVLGPGRNYDRQPLNPSWENSGRPFAIW